MEEDPLKIYRIVLLGEAGVGKSSLMRRYTQGYFSTRSTTTVGVDRIPISVDLGDGEKITFQVLDTSGCYGFRGLIQSYVTNVDAVVFMYDLSNKETFASLPLWNGVLKHCQNKDVTKILVGNKMDLAETHREVAFKSAKNYADFENMSAMEISVKEADSVELVFQSVAREMRMRQQKLKQLEEEQRQRALLKKNSSRKTMTLGRRLKMTGKSVDEANDIRNNTIKEEQISSPVPSPTDETSNAGSEWSNNESKPQRFVRRLSLLMGRRKKGVDAGFNNKTDTASPLMRMCQTPILRSKFAKIETKTPAFMI